MSTPVSATFWYLKDLDLWKTTKPYFINVPNHAIPTGHLRSNEVSVPISGVPVRNMRECLSELDLDKNGFVCKTHAFSTSEEAFRDPAVIRQSYIPEVEQWLRTCMGAESAHVLTSEGGSSFAASKLLLIAHRYGDETPTFRS
jgi:hypothetical protein